MAGTTRPPEPARTPQAPGRGGGVPRGGVRGVGHGVVCGDGAAHDGAAHDGGAHDGGAHDGGAGDSGRDGGDGGVGRERPVTQLLRFDRGERVLHWVNATLFGVLVVTASVLYVPPLSGAIGRRELVKTLHVYAGLALPVPLLATAAARRWGSAFRADVRRLNRWSADDRRWLRSRGRDRSVRLGKFNAGQKLNAAFVAGSIPVMLGTGAIMRWPQQWPLSWRTGATFVHDWVYLGLAVTIVGHILFATNDKASLASMRHGWISGAWARRHAPRWWDEQRRRSADDDRRE